MTWSVVDDGDGSPKIILAEPAGSTAVVLLKGGQIVSWKNDRHEELLFMGSKAIKKPPKAVKGGIPICFSEFGDTGFQHRNRLWILDSDPSPLPPPRTNSSVDLLLKSSNEDDLKIWPSSFELRLRIILGPGKLTVIPRVRNTDNRVIPFSFSMQNYLSVSNVSEVRVEGLETLDYFDNLSERKRHTEQADAITFDGEVIYCYFLGFIIAIIFRVYYHHEQVDRVYLSTPPKIAIIDHEKKRTLVLRKEGLPDAVVWNPWDKKAKMIPEFGYEDYKSMLCVDSSAIEAPVILKPLEEWKGQQELSIVSSSYCSGQLDPHMVLHG